MAQQARLRAGPTVAPAAAQSWLEQFVYEIAMLRFADRFASDHEKGVATWREQNLGTEGVLVHARILHAFFVGPGGAVPRWAPFGSASDRIGDFPTTGFLTDGEFLGMAGALGRFGSYSTGFSVWNRADIVKRALAACAAFADALPADEGDSVRRVCSAAA